MRTVAGLALLVWLAPAGAGAQPQDRFIACSFTSPPQPAILYEVAPSGTVLATVATLPAGHVPFGLVMAADNRSYVALTYLQPTRTGCLLDVDPNGSMRTLVAGNPLYRPVALARDSDGGWILAHQGFTIYDLDFFRVQGTTLTSLSTVPGLYAYATAVDEDSGLLVVRGMDRKPPYDCGYFRVDPRTGTVTQFAIHRPAQTSAVYYGAKEPPFEGPSGSFIDVYYDTTTPGARMCRAHAKKGIQPFTSTVIPWLPIDLAAADQRTAGVGWYLLGSSASSPSSFEIIRMKPDGSFRDASPIRGFTPYNRSTLLRIGSRHLAWFMDTPPNGRRLELSFPGEGGRAYVVGLSWTGFRPGLGLPDGRVIPLSADYLTMLCLYGGIKGILDNTLGSLDASGRARVTVNTNPFGKALNGLRIWAVALVLDAGAPLGAAYIAGPSLLTLR
jgi:hypothetical protein